MDQPVSDAMPDPNQTAPAKPGSRELNTFWIALLSGAMMWFAFPPVGFSWLAWVAPVPLILLARVKSLPGQHPYRQLYFAGLLYWLATFYFIPIPHPLLWVGWLLVSAYMAIYTPIFVGVSRTLINRTRIPGAFVFPVVWTGIEWIRCNFATGMAMVCLSHSQYKSPLLIQVADLSGAYTLTFAMIVVAVGISSVAAGIWIRKWPDSGLCDARHGSGRNVAEIVAAIVVFAMVIIYGQFRLNEEAQLASQAELKVGLIQTSDDVVFRPLSEQEYVAQLQGKFLLTAQARNRWNDLDMVVWPESGFLYPDFISDGVETVESAANYRTQVWSEAVGYPKQFASPIPLLTGGGTRDPENGRVYGSAFLIANDGQIETRYFKIHLVMFGEYVPFADWFPWIKQLSPIGGGISSGESFEVISRNGISLAPSICFESTIPHFIRRQINELAAAGKEPDAMVNMTNDGWFRGTSCLDLHLACNVFRAVEMRKSHLVCANTGLSAEIDPCGRLVQVGPRRQEAVLRTVIRPTDRASLYREIGDSIPIALGVIVVLGFLIGVWKRNA